MGKDGCRILCVLYKVDYTERHVPLSKDSWSCVSHVTRTVWRTGPDGVWLGGLCPRPAQGPAVHGDPEGSRGTAGPGQNEIFKIFLALFYTRG
jgi:hypothetical protein